MSGAIAIFRTGGIGDVILSTVSIQIIKKHFPDIEIIWFGREPCNDLIRNAFPDIKIMDLDKENSYRDNLKLIRSAKGNWLGVIDLQRSARTIILSLYACIIKRCKYTTWNKRSFKRTLFVLRANARGRKANWKEKNNDLPNRYELMTEATVRAMRKCNLFMGNNVTVTPGFKNLISVRDEYSVAIGLGAKFEAKSLPVVKVKGIIEVILNNSSVNSIYFLGDENQKNIADSIMSEYCEKINFTNLCGMTTLTEAARALSKCCFAVVNDSALAHLSESVNTPVITFFGPTHQNFGYRPFLKKSSTFSVNLSCRPCNKNGNTKCRYNDYLCSGLIQPSQIVVNINKILNAG